MSDIKMTLKESVKCIEELEEMVCFMWAELWEVNKVSVKGLSRKEMLMAILIGGKLWSVKDLSEKMSEKVGKEISSRNISSLLSYIRDESEKSTALQKKGKEYCKLYYGNLVRVGRGVGKLKWVKGE